MQEQMHTLVQGIVGAYEARVSSLAALQKQVVAQRNEARGHVEGLRRTRQAMARRQRDHLSKGRADLTRSVAGQLRELDATHQTMARRQRAELARGRAALTQVETRRSSEVEGWLKEIAGSRQAMAQRQREDLSRGRAGLRDSVSAQLQELDQAHNAMTQQQREDLARGHAGLIRAERLRKSEVKTWIEDVAAIHAGARAVWQELTATMGAKRAGGVAVAEAPPATPVTVATEEEEAVAGAVVGEVTEEFSTLRGRVFEYLANHPDGARLTEIERDFGLGRFEATRVVRSLINDGKTEKRDLLYFAI